MRKTLWTRGSAADCRQEATGPGLGSLLSRERLPVACLLGILWRLGSQVGESIRSASLAGVSAEWRCPHRGPEFPPYCSEAVVTSPHLIPGFGGNHCPSALLPHDISISQFREVTQLSALNPGHSREKEESCPLQISF